MKQTTFNPFKFYWGSNLRLIAKATTNQTPRGYFEAKYEDRWKLENYEKNLLSRCQLMSYRSKTLQQDRHVKASTVGPTYGTRKGSLKVTNAHNN